MAFATSNVRSSVFGDLKVTYGDWTGVQADAPGTIGVTGGRIYLCSFSSQDASGEYNAETKFTTSTTGAVTTVTIYNVADVTTGRFIIIHS